VLYRHVPRELIERPKMGFSVPIAAWLRGPLRHWTEELLDRGKLERDGIFNASVVREVWDGHLAGDINAHNELWAVLMFQSWYDKQRASKE